MISAFEYRYSKEINYHNYNDNFFDQISKIEILKKFSQDIIINDSNIISSLIECILKFLISVIYNIDNILANLAYWILIGNGHNFNGLIYKLLYFLHLINLKIGEFLIELLNLISEFQNRNFSQ